MSLSFISTSVCHSRLVPSISGILKAQHRHPLWFLSVFRDMLPGVTTLHFSSRSRRRAAFFVRLGLGFCRRSKRDASLEDRWLPLDGAGCDRLQVDACCFKVGWFGRAGLRLAALLCHGPPSWCSDHHPLMCGLARWARRRPRWDSWNLGGGGGRPRARRGRRPRSHRGQLVRAADLVRPPSFLRLSVSALRVLRAAALVLRSMIALVEVDVSWHPRAWPSQA